MYTERGSERELRYYDMAGLIQLAGYETDQEVLLNRTDRTMSVTAVCYPNENSRIIYARSNTYNLGNGHRPDIYISEEIPGDKVLKEYITILDFWLLSNGFPPHLSLTAQQCDNFNMIYSFPQATDFEITTRHFWVNTARNRYILERMKADSVRIPMSNIKTA